MALLEGAYRRDGSTVGQSPTPGNEQPNTPPDPPVNPVYSGAIGKTSLYLALAGLGVFALFLGLDTIQYIETGHESVVFGAIARGFGAVGIGSVVVTLVKTYLQPRK